METKRIFGNEYSADSVILSAIPGDKSISHRVAILGSLATGETHFEGFLCSEDCLNTVGIMRAMGADITLDHETGKGVVNGKGLRGLVQPTQDLDVGNSGTSIRLLAGLLAGQCFSSVLIGDSSIMQRPMKRVSHPLSLMGAHIEGSLIEGRSDLFPPLTIHGKSLQSICYESPVASAQVKSSILLAGLFSEGMTTVVEPRKSRDHTERLLQGYGVDCRVNGLEITLTPPQILKAPNESLMIPSDFSSASFFLVLAAVSPGVTLIIKRVGLNSTRKALLDVLLDMGADVSLQNQGGDSFEPYADLVIVGKRLKNVDLSPDIVPFIIDEIPILAVAALFSEGTLRVTQSKELRVKESDRIKGIVNLITAFGCHIEEHDDGFVLQEQRVTVDSVKFDCLHDHRLAMSAIIAALIAKCELEVWDVRCIQTSFPSFFECLTKFKVS